MSTTNTSTDTPTPIPPPATPAEVVPINPTEEEPEEDDEDLEEDLEEDEDEDEDEDDEDEGAAAGRRTGRGLTLKTLLAANVLQPGEGYMTINYLGNKFKGDLLADGRIRSQETSKIFSTPSAWAIYCKKIVNPDKKSGCGWASVRYRGKKLDAYKNNWYRQKRLEFEREGEEMDDDSSIEDSDGGGTNEHQETVDFEAIGARHPNHDMNQMVETTSFQSLGRMQPFNVTMSSSAMAVIDVHAHLTKSEVVGYLAGQWDVNNHNLIVSHAMPVLCRLGDAEKGPIIEQNIHNEMKKLNLSLVGWYHTHPFTAALPTLKDIDTQLEYEMKMKGYNDATYTPCIGIISSPYERDPSNPKEPGKMNGFWVMPPPEHKPQEYGRPMNMQFNVVQDAFIPKEALIYMRNSVAYYVNAKDAIKFQDTFMEDVTYWMKLKNSLNSRVPYEHIVPLLEFLGKLLDIKITPEEIEELKKERKAAETKEEAKVKAEVKDEIVEKKDTEVIMEEKPQTVPTSSAEEIGTPLPATITLTPISNASTRGNQPEQMPPVTTKSPSPKPAFVEPVKPVKMPVVEIVPTEKLRQPAVQVSEDSEMSVPSAPQLQALAEAHLSPMDQMPVPQKHTVEVKALPKVSHSFPHHSSGSVSIASLLSNPAISAISSMSSASSLSSIFSNPISTASSSSSSVQDSHPSQYTSPSKLLSMLQDDHQQSKLQSLLHDKQSANIHSYLQEQMQNSKLQSMLQEKQQAFLQEQQHQELQAALKEQQDTQNLYALLQAQQSGSLNSYLQEQQSNALQNLIKEHQTSTLQNYLEDQKKLQSMMQEQKKATKYPTIKEQLSSKFRMEQPSEPPPKYPSSLVDSQYSSKLQNILQEKQSSKFQMPDGKDSMSVMDANKSLLGSMAMGQMHHQSIEERMKAMQPHFMSHLPGMSGADDLSIFQQKLPSSMPSTSSSAMESSYSSKNSISALSMHPLTHLQQSQALYMASKSSLSDPKLQRSGNEDEPMEVDRN